MSVSTNNVKMCNTEFDWEVQRGIEKVSVIKQSRVRLE